MSKKPETIIYVSVEDLVAIRSRAVAVMVDLPIDHKSELDSHTTQALCYLESLTGFLRSKGLIDFKIEYRKRRG